MEYAFLFLHVRVNGWVVSLFIAVQEHQHQILINMFGGNCVWTFRNVADETRNS